MFSGGGGSGSTYFVEVAEEEDVASDGGLCQEHCLLFSNGEGKAVGRCAKAET